MPDKTKIFQKLKEIELELRRDNNRISKKKKKQFWKIVDEIKRDPYPNEKNVILTSEIREI